jgi:hypothetical protein
MVEILKCAGGFRCGNLLCASLDPVHYMILLGSKYDPNMNRELVILLFKPSFKNTVRITKEKWRV